MGNWRLPIVSRAAHSTGQPLPRDDPGGPDQVRIAGIRAQGSDFGVLHAHDEMHLLSKGRREPWNDVTK